MLVVLQQHSNATLFIFKLHNLGAQEFNEKFLNYIEIKKPWLKNSRPRSRPPRPAREFSASHCPRGEVSAGRLVSPGLPIARRLVPPASTSGMSCHQSPAWAPQLRALLSMDVRDPESGETPVEKMCAYYQTAAQRLTTPSHGWGLGARARFHWRVCWRRASSKFCTEGVS